MTILTLGTVSESRATMYAFKILTLLYIYINTSIYIYTHTHFYILSVFLSPPFSTVLYDMHWLELRLSFIVYVINYLSKRGCA